jgi:coenzyme F420 hydrogenase subunit beta
MTAAFQSPVLRKIVENDLCSGCGACAALSNGAISMEVVAPGFNRPRQSSPIDKSTEQAIAIVCPGATLAPWPATGLSHPYWGPYRGVMTGNATDPALRHAASSGGLISALLCYGLESGEIDAVVHIVQDPDDPTRNVHSISETPGQIAEAAVRRFSAAPDG